MTDLRTPKVPGQTQVSTVEAQFKLLTDAMPQMVWSTLPDGHHDYYNARWYEFTGVPDGSTDGEAWNGMFHPDDRERAWERWRHSLATGEPYEIEYRLRHRTGVYRWTLGRARPIRDENGEIVRWVGTCTDIDDNKRTADQNDLLSRELSHRIKNIFAIISGVIAMSARHHPEARGFAGILRDRIAALGRAHEFVRPHSEESRPTADRTTLKGVLEELFKPYPAFEEGRLVVAGDDCPVDDRGATPLALLFHELATNAMKYGALSLPDGEVTVTIAADDGIVRIDWRERGGPPIEQAPVKSGFGTRLTEISVSQQLGGTLGRAWEREGLVAAVTIDRARLARDEAPATGA